MKKHIFLIFTMLWSCFAFAQIKVGSFRSHISASRFFSLAADEESIYAASTNGLMVLEKSTMYDPEPSITVWSKVEGLSDVDIAKVYHDDTFDYLILCYINGNIDFIRHEKVISFTDIKDKPISGSKLIQNCRFYDGKAYMVYPFGVVIVDLERLIISDTWFTRRENGQVNATDITRDDARFYVSTEEGIFSMSRFSPMLSNFGQWTEENTMNVSFLAELSDQVFAVKKSSGNIDGEMDTLMIRTNDGWMATDKSFQFIRGLNVKNNLLTLLAWDRVESYDRNLERRYLASWFDGVSYPDARDCILDNDNIWVADLSYGLVQCNMTYYTNYFYKASGPYVDYVEKVTSKDGIVAAVHGTHKASTAYSPGYRHPAVSWFQNQEWQYNNTDFLYYDPQRMTFDFADIAIHPKDETEWSIASWGNGVFRCKNHHPVEHYNARNSVLDSTGTGKTFVSAVQYDKKGNLWMTNSYCPTMLKLLTKDGIWYSYNITNGIGMTSMSEVVAEKLLIDSRGYKWVNFPRQTKYPLIAFTDNGTFDNPSDDRLARIDMNVAAEVNSSTVYCMAEDLDGEIWIGTDKGVKVIYYPSKVFDGNVYPRNILLEQDGYVSVLLEYEEVTAIAVDGANRKWIGTSKAGVFLMSENGQKQLLHFTAEDNPLFSNQIVDINIDQMSGEVFFSTDKGLVSYRGTATTGSETYEDLLVFPNPVPSGYSSVVTVSGLKSNTLCKITDSSGKLVWQGYSDGGQLAWYCKDHYGNRPASGVYYVMASDEEGKDKMVTKFVFIH